MTGDLAGIFLLIALAAPGVAILRRCNLGLDRFSQIAFGGPLGMVATTLILLLLSVFVNFGRGLVYVVAAASLAFAFLIWPRNQFSRVSRIANVATRSRVGAPAWGIARVRSFASNYRWSIIVLAGFAIWWAVLWHGMVEWKNGALFAGAPLWGDWAQHVGDVSSFVYGHNVPPDFPRYAGHPYGYHYLASLTAAAMVEVGTSPTSALVLHSWALSVFIALGVYAFVRRLFSNGGIAALSVVFFFLGGNLGWTVVASDAVRHHHVWDLLVNRSFENGPQQAAHFVWQNVYFVSIAPQRGYLYGLPLSLLVLTLLWNAIREGAVRQFLAAGLVAGLLPFAHLGPLPALAMISATLFVAFPSRKWVWFFGPWVALTLPQLYLQQGGEQGTLGGLRWQVGWLAPPDHWWWFWLKNLGLFIPLLFVGFFDKFAVPPLAKRFLLAFMPIFVIANLVVFQPDPWDNAKVLNYWFLAASVVCAAALCSAWRQGRMPVVRFLIILAAATMTLSGVLHNVQAEHEKYLWLTREEVHLAELIRQQTPADAVFAVGLQPNNPVAMLSGRSVVLSYPGWFWPRGIDVVPVEQDLRSIYSLGPNTDALIQQYRISYLVIGPWERGNFHPDVIAFEARFPVVIRTESYEVFAVKG